MYPMYTLELLTLDYLKSIGFVREGTTHGYRLRLTHVCLSVSAPLANPSRWNWCITSIRDGNIDWPRTCDLYKKYYNKSQLLTLIAGLS